MEGISLRVGLMWGDLKLLYYYVKIIHFYFLMKKSIKLDTHVQQLFYNFVYFFHFLFFAHMINHKRVAWQGKFLKKGNRSTNSSISSLPPFLLYIIYIQCEMNKKCLLSPFYSKSLFHTSYVCVCVCYTSYRKKSVCDRKDSSGMNNFTV